MSKHRRRKQKLPQELVETVIEDLSAEGRGVTHINGKVTFIDFALSGEKIRFEYTRTSSKFDEGKAVEIMEPSADRVEPACQHFGVCGGCSLQHMQHDAQIMAKQQTLLNHLQHIAHTQADTVLPPLRGPVYGYRHKARLGVRYVAKKGKVLVGFREKTSGWLAELESCKVLHPSVGERLSQLGELIMGMDAKQTIPQIEVAVSDDITSLVFRHLEDLSDADKEKLCDFAEAENLHIYLQPGGEDSVHPLWPAQHEPLFYELKDHNVRIEFSPSDFTQVNPDINQQMVTRALNFLQLNENDKVLDLFCGLGNFTLPIARHAGQVIGVEGSESMVVKA
ncbi:MAG TPA: 23S rRNA (uracil(1939)-C(5))-methyltransferase RlmD, partial [Gammaproteobacteria bacterium]